MQRELISNKAHWFKFACMAILIACFHTSAAQTNDNELHSSRLIIQWKRSTAHTHAQQLESVANELHKTTGLMMRRRRGISEHMDGMQLNASLNKTELRKVLSKLNANAEVEFAVEDKRRYAHALTNDPLITASSGRTGQWYLNSPDANSEWVAAINAISAWDFSTGGAAGNGVIVAVVDTGIRPDHEDLAGKLLPGYDFVDCDQLPCTGSGLTYFIANDGDGWDSDPQDPGDWVSSEDKANHPGIFDNSCDTGDSSWHGTRVAGIIGAATNNGKGIAGIGYNARILPIRVLSKCGGYDSDITAGMRWAAGLAVPGAARSNPNRAQIINLSLGSADTCNQLYMTTINEIRALGISVVASAGNDSAATNVPANCPGVIGVVAIRNAGTKVGFSSLGTEVTISAPGGNCGTGTNCAFSIDTTTNLGTQSTTQTCPTPQNANAKCLTTPGVNDYTDQLNPNLGTSFSAPIVSGTIALMLGANPNLTPDVIIAKLKATATAFPQTATNSCVAPTGTTPLANNESECNCTTSLCGAGMVNALKAVQSVALPTIVITGNSTVAQGGTDVLDASTSTTANGSQLTYAWSIVSDTSNAATPRSGSTASFTVMAPNADENLVVRLRATDSLNNTASKDFTIVVGAGGSSSSSASSINASSSSSSSIVTVSGATHGGGELTWQWLISLTVLLFLRITIAKSSMALYSTQMNQD